MTKYITESQKTLRNTKAYSKLIRTSKMKFLAKIVNTFHALTIFAKSSILDVRLGSENDLAIYFHIYNFNKTFIKVLKLISRTSLEKLLL